MCVCVCFDYTCSGPNVLTCIVQYSVKHLNVLDVNLALNIIDLIGSRL